MQSVRGSSGQMKCGHSEEHQCSQCGRCNGCEHKYVERADGWWKRCLFKWVKVIPARKMQS